MAHVLELISVWAIPLVVAFVSVYAIIKKVPVLICTQNPGHML